jgi:hypothetical protein
METLRQLAATTNNPQSIADALAVVLINQKAELNQLLEEIDTLLTQYQNGLTTKTTQSETDLAAFEEALDDKLNTDAAGAYTTYTNGLTTKTTQSETDLETFETTLATLQSSAQTLLAQIQATKDEIDEILANISTPEGTLFNVDIINEHTPDHGVLVEGTTLKDGNIIFQQRKGLDFRADSKGFFKGLESIVWRLTQAVSWEGWLTAWAPAAYTKNENYLGRSSLVCTVSQATPAVVTAENHPLLEGDIVFFSTTGGLPAGLTAGQCYFVVNCTTDSFGVSLSKGGIAINTSSTGSGTHTIHKVPAGHNGGLFSFSSTGYWSIRFVGRAINTVSADSVQIEIHSSTNNSSFSVIASNNAHVTGNVSTSRNTCYTEALIMVTDTAMDVFKLYQSAGHSSSQFIQDTTSNTTMVILTKHADL